MTKCIVHMSQLRDIRQSFITLVYITRQDTSKSLLNFHLRCFSFRLNCNNTGTYFIRRILFYLYDNILLVYSIVSPSIVPSDMETEKSIEADNTANDFSSPSLSKYILALSTFRKLKSCITYSESFPQEKQDKIVLKKQAIIRFIFTNFIILIFNYWSCPESYISGTVSKTFL